MSPGPVPRAQGEVTGGGKRQARSRGWSPTGSSPQEVCHRLRKDGGDGRRCGTAGCYVIESCHFWPSGGFPTARGFSKPQGVTAAIHLIPPAITGPHLTLPEFLGHCRGSDIHLSPGSPSASFYHTSLSCTASAAQLVSQRSHQRCTPTSPPTLARSGLLSPALHLPRAPGSCVERCQARTGGAAGPETAEVRLGICSVLAFYRYVACRGAV